MIENNQRYFKKDKYGHEFFDYHAYEDNEQMRILSQMSQENQMERSRVASYGILSFFRKRKTLNSLHIRDE